MKRYKIPVSWEMYGTITISAPSLQEALVKAFSPEQGLPADGDYIDDSFKVDNDDGQMMALSYPGEDFNIKKAKETADDNLT